jgi:hypothetical protein
MLFIDEAQFNQAGINSTQNLHLWPFSNPHGTIESFSHYIVSLND